MVKRRKVRYSRVVILLAVCGFVVFGIYQLVMFGVSFFTRGENLKPCFYDQNESLTLSVDLYSKYYDIFSLKDGIDYYAWQDDEVIYPASLTKLMTLDTVLSLGEDLDQLFAVTSDDFILMYERNASVAGLTIGEEYRLEELLYAMVLPSGADACMALVRFFDEKGIDLVAKMNERAMALGMTSSHFENTTGLFEENHVTTMNDLKKMMMDLWSFEVGQEVLKSMKYEMDDGDVLYSSLARYGLDEVTDAVVLGGKTGYTYESKLNLIVVYEVEGEPFCMMLACADGDTSNGEYYHAFDAMHIIEHLYGEKEVS